MWCWIFGGFSQSYFVMPQELKRSSTWVVISISVSPFASAPGYTQAAYECRGLYRPRERPKRCWSFNLTTPSHLIPTAYPQHICLKLILMLSSRRLLCLWSDHRSSVCNCCLLSLQLQLIAACLLYMNIRSAPSCLYEPRNLFLCNLGS